MALLNIKQLVRLILLVLENLHKDKLVKEVQIEAALEKSSGHNKLREDVEKAVKVVLAEVGENAIVN